MGAHLFGGEDRGEQLVGVGRDHISAPAHHRGVVERVAESVDATCPPRGVNPELGLVQQPPHEPTEH